MSCPTHLLLTTWQTPLGVEQCKVNFIIRYIKLFYLFFEIVLFLLKTLTIMLISFRCFLLISLRCDSIFVETQNYRI